MTWDHSCFEKPTPEELHDALSEEQFRITQAGGTERAFQNRY